MPCVLSSGQHFNLEQEQSGTFSGSLPEYPSFLRILNALGEVLRCLQVLRKCYDLIRLHQHVLRPRLRNPRHSRPTPIRSGTTPCTPLRTPLGLRSTILRTPRTFVLTSPLPAPFVLLAIGRVPMTHKARFCCCFFVP